MAARPGVTFDKESAALHREYGLASLLRNLEQTVFGEPAYPSVESKAAHLLYFVINDTGLAAITLLIAESDPQQKEVIIRLVMTMLA